MKIALGQVNLVIGDIKGNFNNVKNYIEQAVGLGAELIVLPELTTTVKDADGLLFDIDYRAQAEEFFSELVSMSKDIDIVVGAPQWRENGVLVNGAFFMHGGISHMVAANVPYGLSVFEINGYKFQVLIGGKTDAIEDVDFVINMNSTPFVKQTDCSKYQPVKGIKTININHVGLSKCGVYVGESFIADEKGEYLAVAQTANAELLVVDINKNERVQREQLSNEAEIFNTLSFAMREFCRINRFERAILGLSGGIDSALTAAILCDALGAENVLGITMPSKYSTEGSWNDSYELAKNLGMECKTIPIKPLFETFVNDIQSQQYGDLAEENLQSRLRGNILMTFANRENRVLLSTGNKSEAAMGYCTLYGDTAGGINLIADLYKQEVYALSRYVNRNGEVIPENTITKPPSAELRPDQKDSDSLPDYAILDDILHRYIEEEQTVDEISQFYDKTLVKDIVNKLNRMEFKRQQFTFCVKVSKKSMTDRNFPLINSYRI